MDKAKENLKWYSYILIFLGFIDIVIMVTEYLLGNMNVDYLVKNMNVTEDSARNSIILALALNAFVYVATFYVGVKGVQQAKGKCKGEANITLAKIMYAINVVVLICCVIATVTTDLKVRYLFTYFIYISCYHPYVKCAKALNKAMEEKQK